MRKIVLGTTPKNFKRQVEVTLPDGETSKIEISFIYRTRTELAKFFSDINAEIDNSVAGKQIESMADLTAVELDADVETLMQIMDGWNLEVEFNEANVRQFCDELPEASMDIVNNYFLGSRALRTGN